MLRSARETTIRHRSHRAGSRPRTRGTTTPRTGTMRTPSRHRGAAQRGRQRQRTTSPSPGPISGPGLRCRQHGRLRDRTRLRRSVHVCRQAVARRALAACQPAECLRALPPKPTRWRVEWRAEWHAPWNGVRLVEGRRTRWHARWRSMPTRRWRAGWRAPWR